MSNEQTELTPAQPKAEISQAARPTTLKGWLQSDSFKSQIAAALPAVCTPERFMRVALTTLMRVPKLADCSQNSVLKCFLDCASIGIEPDGRRAHLIPYGKDCTLIIDYKGLVELVRRSGDVLKIHASAVCENDVFEHDLGVVTKHVIDWRKPRGKAYAYYATAEMKGGVHQCEVMTREEVDAIRARSKAGRSGPWASDYDEMAKKTVFRRLAKWLPFSAELRKAEEIDDRHNPISSRPVSAGDGPVFDLPADDSGSTSAEGEEQ